MAAAAPLPTPGLPCNLNNPIIDGRPYKDIHIEWEKNAGGNFIGGKIGESISIRLNDCAYYNGLYGKIVKILFLEQKNEDGTNCEPPRTQIPFTFIFRSETYQRPVPANIYYELLMYDFSPQNFKLIKENEDSLLYNSINPRVRMPPQIPEMSFVADEGAEPTYRLFIAGGAFLDTSANNNNHRVSLSGDLTNMPKKETIMFRSRYSNENLIKKDIIDLEAHLGWVESHREMRQVLDPANRFWNQNIIDIQNVGAAAAGAGAAAQIEAINNLFDVTKNDLVGNSINSAINFETNERNFTAQPSDANKILLNQAKTSCRDSWKKIVIFRTIEHMVKPELRSDLIKEIEGVGRMLAPQQYTIPPLLPPLPRNINEHITEKIELIKAQVAALPVEEPEEPTPGAPPPPPSFKKRCNAYIDALGEYYIQSRNEERLYKKTQVAFKFGGYRGLTREKLVAGDNTLDYDEHTLLDAVHELQISDNPIANDKIMDEINKFKNQGVVNHKSYRPNVSFFPPDFNFAEAAVPNANVFLLTPNNNPLNAMNAINNLFGSDLLVYDEGNRNRIISEDIGGRTINKRNLAVLCNEENAKTRRKREIAAAEKTRLNAIKAAVNQEFGQKSRKPKSENYTNRGWKPDSTIENLNITDSCIIPPMGNPFGPVNNLSLSFNFIRQILEHEFNYNVYIYNIGIGQIPNKGVLYFKNIFEWFGKFMEQLQKKETIGAILKKYDPRINSYYTISTTVDQNQPKKYRFIFNTPYNINGDGARIFSCNVNEYELLRLMGKLNNISDIIFVQNKEGSERTKASEKISERSPAIQAATEKRVQNFIDVDIPILQEIISKKEKLNIIKKYVPIGYPLFVDGIRGPEELVEITGDIIFPKDLTDKSPGVADSVKESIILPTSPYANFSRGVTPSQTEIVLRPDNVRPGDTGNPWSDPNISEWADDTKNLLKVVFVDGGKSSYNVIKRVGNKVLDDSIEKAKKIAKFKPFPTILEKLKLYHIALGAITLGAAAFFPPVTIPLIAAGTTGLGAKLVVNAGKAMTNVSKDARLTSKQKEEEQFKILGLTLGKLLAVGAVAAAGIAGIAYARSKPPANIARLLPTLGDAIKDSKTGFTISNPFKKGGLRKTKYSLRKTRKNRKYRK